MPVRKPARFARVVAALLLLSLVDGCGSAGHNPGVTPSAATLSSPAATTAPTSAAPAIPSSTDYDEAYRIGLEAYTYGLPLL